MRSVLRVLQPRIFATNISDRKMFSTGSAKQRTYPKTLEGFGYGFTDDGKLRQIDKETGKLTDKGFDFNIYTSAHENQDHYEALGDAITDVIYEKLETTVGLKKIYMPDDVPREEATFIFSTQEKLDKPKKLLVLIHGSGVVRAGQWARSLIINHSLDSGTQIPYINKGRELGYEVLLTNTNDNYRKVGSATKGIKGSRNPTEHAVSVFEKHVIACDPEAVAIVAHSYGGVVTVELAQKFPKFFKEKVFAVGFTDSVHSSSLVPEVLVGIGRNWVSSKEPLDTTLTISKQDLPRYSAGHIKHEMTSYSCMDALFKFFEERYEQFKVTDAGPDSKKLKSDL
ncbi:FAM172 family protein homolog CG10038 isoform X2 [Malaya genurostris]|uniref:FAM172 family protein homolog CG10038 isoform X2 n=1 Tax=Malaya genurostris TaxID=325434 RepID=UPI0026F3C4A7|nr:FAM172 family protein homolog CG10038 isoform X2 [Malaya genurostris]XP_058452111.1 FAM172 family protein homolog CG10038 isoform X2 [Malaya genurostris]